MKNIKFSIIIPNYNKGPYIKECLNSVINQTYKNYEIIFIDDGSTDESLDVIKNYDLRLFKTKHLYAGGARNKGIDESTGDYIVFLDSDDYFTSNNVLEKLANLIKDEDIIFLNYTRNEFGDITFVENKITSLADTIENTKNLGCPTKCFKKELLDGIRFPLIPRYEDINFALEAMCKAKTYAVFNDSFFTYRKVKKSNTTTKIDGKTMLEILQELIKMYHLCIKYPKYKLNILNRIKHDKLDKRLEILNHLIETGENTFYDYF